MLFNENKKSFVDKSSYCKFKNWTFDKEDYLSLLPKISTNERFSAAYNHHSKVKNFKEAKIIPSIEHLFKFVYPTNNLFNKSKFYRWNFFLY